jgi:hypothetical protein
VELGLVPIGAVFLIIFTAMMSFVIQWDWPTRVCLVLVGIAASFYIVPLYTLLQHRAPKNSKGNLVATSNFVNVAGGMLAVAVFYLITFSLEKALPLFSNRQLAGTELELIGNRVLELEDRMQIPKILFLTLSVLTAGMLLLLCRKLPDFFVRTLLWLRSHGRYRLKVVGVNNLPSDGAVILATNCDRFETCMQVVTATDRFTRFVLLESEDDERPPWLLRYLAKRTGLVALPAKGAAEDIRTRALARASRAIAEGNLLGITAVGDAPPEELARLLGDLRKENSVPILPVYCGALTAESKSAKIRRMLVVIGHPVPTGSTTEEIQQSVKVLGEWMRQIDQSGAPALTAMIPGVASASLKVATAPGRPAHP